jgi:hypothetical protein
VNRWSPLRPWLIRLSKLSNAMCAKLRSVPVVRRQVLAQIGHTDRGFADRTMVRQQPPMVGAHSMMALGAFPRTGAAGLGYDAPTDWRSVTPGASSSGAAGSFSSAL